MPASISTRMGNDFFIKFVGQSNGQVNEQYHTGLKVIKVINGDFHRVHTQWVGLLLFTEFKLFCQYDNFDDG